MQPPLPETAAAEPLRPYTRPDPAARRARMRDFQTRLVERVQAARGGTDLRAGQLGVQIGTGQWLLDLPQAGEIVAVSSITRVPLTQPWFLGLANIRGSLVSVVDLAHFLGGARTPIDKQCRIIAFGPRLGFTGAILVARVLGLRNIADMRAQAEPAGGDSAYRDGDGGHWQHLDLAAVTQDPRFLHVGV
jgi:twitching motility protein PilI